MTIENEQPPPIDGQPSAEPDWRELHDQLLIKQEITNAANKHDAVRADRLVKLLCSQTKVVQEIDDQGNHHFSVRIVDTDESGKPTLVTPDEAVARLKADPAENAGLFKDFVVPEFGGTATAPLRKDGDSAKNIPMDEFARRFKEDRKRRSF